MQQVEQYLKISNPAAEVRRKWGRLHTAMHCNAASPIN
jgi:hypothetical protein